MPIYFNNVQDSKGNAITGAEITVLNSPADTVASLFEDDGVTPLTNPIPIGSEFYNGLGQFRFFVADGDYRIRVVNDGQTQFIGPVSIRSAGASPSGPLGAVQLSNGTGGLISDDANFLYDTVNDRLGLGTNVPDRLLELRSALTAYLRIRNTGADNVLLELQRDTAAANDIVGRIIARDSTSNLAFFTVSKDSNNETQITIEDAAGNGGVTLTRNPLGNFGFDITLSGDISVEGTASFQDTLNMNANDIEMDAAGVSEITQLGYNGANLTTPLSGGVLPLTSDIVIFTLAADQAITTMSATAIGTSTHREVILIVKQNGTGGFDITSWPSNVIWPSDQTAPTIPSGANEFLAIRMVSDGTNWHASPLSLGTGGGGTTPVNIKRCTVNFTAATQSPTSGTNLAFDNEVRDIGAFHDNITNNDRLTIPADMALAQVSAGIDCSLTGTAGTSTYAFTIEDQGGNIIASRSGVIAATVEALSFTLETDILSVSQNDYFVLQYTGTATATVNGSSGSDPTWFRIEERFSTVPVSSATAPTGDEFVKVTSNDLTAGVLQDKLVAGQGIRLSERNDGAFETFEVESIAIGQPLVSKAKGADTSRSSTVILTTDPQLTDFTLAANNDYTIDGRLEVESTSSTPDLAFQFDVTSGTLIDSRIFVHGIDDPLASADIVSGALDTTLVMPLTANETKVVMISGYVRAGNGPVEIDFDWAQNVSDAANVTIKEGSFIRFVPNDLGAGGINTPAVVAKQRTSNLARASTTTLANDNQLINFVLTAGTWRVEATLPWTIGTPGTDPGIQFKLNRQSGVVSNSSITYTTDRYDSATAGDFLNSGTIEAIHTPTSALNGQFVTRLSGFVQVTNETIFDLQWAQSVSSTVDATLLRGAEIKFLRNDAVALLGTTIADADWIEIASPYKNGWVEFDTGRTIRYRRFADGLVLVQGAVKDGTVGSNVLDATGTDNSLPAGYRPDNTLHFPCNSNDAFGAFTVSETGVLDTRAGSNVFLIINCAYYADQ